MKPSALCILVATLVLAAPAIARAQAPGGRTGDTATHGGGTPGAAAGTPAGGQPAAPAGTGPSAGRDAPAAASPDQGNVQGQTYGDFSERDEKIWRASTQKFIEEGDRTFHSAEALGGTIGVSCDMCHPNASNTHPETYPKYQVQIGRVALLRDMINWCIQNPVRGKPLPDDDVKLKALEAYIYAQRKGVPLQFGKH